MSYLLGRLAGNGLAETDASGVTQREYLWLNDIPIAVVDGVNTASPTLYYVRADHLGRPARMVAQNWGWAWDVIYAPFGGVSAIWDGTSELDMRFPGQWFQLESGLAYNWHRHYDATLGRYVQPDPIGYEGGRSLYGYVGQSPLAYVDPDGRAIAAIPAVCAEFPVLCAGAAAAATRAATDLINGIITFCRGKGGQEPAYDKCIRAANGTMTEWNEFCGTIPMTEKLKAVGNRPARPACYDKAYSSPQEKRNWCYNQFGDQ